MTSEGLQSISLILIGVAVVGFGAALLLHILNR